MDESVRDHFRRIYRAHRTARSWKMERESRGAIVGDAFVAVIGGMVTWRIWGASDVAAFHDLGVPAIGGLLALALWVVVIRPIWHYVRTVPEEMNLERIEQVDGLKKEHKTEVDRLEGKMETYRRSIDGLLMQVETIKAQRIVPDFTGYIDWIGFAPIGNEKVACVICLSVRNRGDAPSALEHWRVRIQPPGQEAQEIPKVEPKKEDSITMVSPSKRFITIAGIELIKFKTSPEGIPRGDMRRGFVMCHVPTGLPFGTRFEVSFRDVEGRGYLCEHETSERNAFDDIGDVPDLPGVNLARGEVSVVPSSDDCSRT